MIKIVIKSAAQAALFAAAPIALVAMVPSPAIAQDDGGEDATHCLSLENNSLMNNCGYLIEAEWCVENVDCKNGTYTNQWTIGANRSYPVQGANTGGTVRWAACKGRNSIETGGFPAYSWQHRCNKGN